MTLIKKLYKLKSSVYYLGKYIIFHNKIVSMIIRVHIHFLSQLNNGVLLRKWKHLVNESVGIFSTLILKYPC